MEHLFGDKRNFNSITHHIDDDEGVCQMETNVHRPKDHKGDRVSPLGPIGHVSFAYHERHNCVPNADAHQDAHGAENVFVLAGILKGSTF